MLMLILGLVLGFWAIPLILGLVGAGRPAEAG
jgi:hypothetical protein